MHDGIFRVWRKTGDVERMFAPLQPRRGTPEKSTSPLRHQGQSRFPRAGVLVSRTLSGKMYLLARSDIDYFHPILGEGRGRVEDRVCSDCSDCFFVMMPESEPDTNSYSPERKQKRSARSSKSTRGYIISIVIKDGKRDGRAISQQTTL